MGPKNWIMAGWKEVIYMVIAFILNINISIITQKANQLLSLLPQKDRVP